MNTQEYISSGILELYVFGSLSKEEALEVETHMSMYPDIKAEVFAIQATMEKYAASTAQAVPADLKEKLFKKIAAEPKLGHETQGKSPVSKTFPLPYYVAAASLLIGVVSTYTSFKFYNQWQDAEGKLQVLVAERTVQANQFQLTKHRLDSTVALTEGKMAMLKDTGSIIINLKGSPKSPEARAKVVWNAQSGAVLVYVNQLPKPPEGKQYQLWALDKGKPVDAGVFQLSGDFQNQREIKSAQAFAVTLENIGGSPVPTLEELYLIGNI